MWVAGVSERYIGRYLNGPLTLERPGGGYYIFTMKTRSKKKIEIGKIGREKFKNDSNTKFPFIITK